MSFMLIVVFGSKNVAAQNAEKLFENHTRWGITGQYNIFSEAVITPTRNNNLSYEILKSKRFAVGLEYNLYQSKNWNFKTGLQLQWFGNELGYEILEPENETSFNLGGFVSTEHDKLVYLPISGEYVFFTTKNLFFSFIAGLNLTYYESYDDETFTTSINDVQLFTSSYKNNSSPMNFGIHFGPSIYLKRKSFMLQMNLVYKKSFSSFRKGTYQFSNLELSPDVSGTIDQSGDFLGAGLTIYFKKRTKK